MTTTVIDVHKQNLVKLGYKSLQDWLDSDEKHIYVGRNMSIYVPGAVGSIWANKFSVKKYGRDKCLELYEADLRSKLSRDSSLKKKLEELRGCTLGCWCHPEPCHGHVLVKILDESFDYG